jgi:L-cysteine S-thiosulfotransferase
MDSGLLWVERGSALWATPEGSRSCASCHGDVSQSMKGVAARYPLVDPAHSKLINIEGRINGCRVQHMAALPLAYESEDLLGLTALIVHQSRGQPFSVKIDGAAAAQYEAGRAFFFERQGQLNVSCNQCHDDNVGRNLRGDKISSGLSTAYPAYRLDWQKVGSLHRRIRACALGVRARQLDFGAPEYVALELYLAHRNGSSAIETPGVRK